MEINTTSLLPYVLDLLSRNPNLSELMIQLLQSNRFLIYFDLWTGSTTEELCEHMKDVVIEDVISPFGSLERAVEFAIELGMNIGILSLTEEKVLMPFKLMPSPSNMSKPKMQGPQCRSLISRLAKTVRDFWK